MAIDTTTYFNRINHEILTERMGIGRIKKHFFVDKEGIKALLSNAKLETDGKLGFERVVDILDEENFDQVIRDLSCARRFGPQGAIYPTLSGEGNICITISKLIGNTATVNISADYNAGKEIKHLFK